MSWPKWMTENRVLAFVQIGIGLGLGTVIAGLLEESWPAFLLGGLAGALLTWVVIRYGRSARARSAEPWPGQHLRSHQLVVLRGELQNLHQLFLRARDATEEADVRWIEVAEYQRGVEARIRNELAIHGDLLTLFHDDTVEPQPESGDNNQTRVVKFLQRRHARLREIIDQYESRYSSQ